MSIDTAAKVLLLIWWRYFAAHFFAAKQLHKICLKKTSPNLLPNNSTKSVANAKQLHRIICSETTPTNLFKINIMQNKTVAKQRCTQSAHAIQLYKPHLLENSPTKFVSEHSTQSDKSFFLTLFKIELYSHEIDRAPMSETAWHWCHTIPNQLEPIVWDRFGGVLLVRKSGLGSLGDRTWDCSISKLEPSTTIDPFSISLNQILAYTNIYTHTCIQNVALMHDERQVFVSLCSYLSRGCSLYVRLGADKARDGLKSNDERIIQ